MELPNSAQEIPPHPPSKASIKAEQLLPLISYCVVMELKKYNIPQVNECQLQNGDNNLDPATPVPSSEATVGFAERPQALGIEEQLIKLAENQEKAQLDSSRVKSSMAANFEEIKCQVREDYAHLSKKLEQIKTDSCLEKTHILNEFTSFKSETNSLITQKLEEITKENLFHKNQAKEQDEKLSQMHLQLVSHSEENARLAQVIKDLKESQKNFLLDAQFKEEIMVMKEAQGKQNRDLQELKESFEKFMAKESQASQQSEEKMKEAHDTILHEQARVNKALEEISLAHTNLKENQAKMFSCQKQIKVTQEQLLKENSEMKEREELILSTQNQTKEKLFEHLRTNQDLISTERGLTRAALDQIKECQKKANDKFYDDLLKVKEDHESFKTEQSKHDKESNNIWKEHCKISKLWDKLYSDQQSLTEDNLKMNNETLKSNAELENMKLVLNKISADQTELAERFSNVKQEVQSLTQQVKAINVEQINISSNTEAEDDDNPSETTARAASSPIASASVLTSTPLKHAEKSSVDTESSNSLRPKDDPEFYGAMNLYDVIDDDDFGDDDCMIIAKEEMKPNPLFCGAEEKESLNQDAVDEDGKTFSLDPEFYCMLVDSEGNEIEEDDPVAIPLDEEVDAEAGAHSTLAAVTEIQNDDAGNLTKDVKYELPSCSVVMEKSEKISNLANVKAAAADAKGVNTRSRSTPAIPSTRK